MRPIPDRLTPVLASRQEKTRKETVLSTHYQYRLYSGIRETETTTFSDRPAGSLLHRSRAHRHTFPTPMLHADSPVAASRIHWSNLCTKDISLPRWWSFCPCSTPYVMLSILLFIVVCGDASLFFACLECLGICTISHIEMAARRSCLFK